MFKQWCMCNTDFLYILPYASEYISDTEINYAKSNESG